MDEVRIVASISDYDAAEIEVGQMVRVQPAAGGTAEGEVDRVSLGANSRTGLFDLEMTVANADHKLKVGTYATAEIRVFESEGDPWIPSACVLRDQEGDYFVWQISKGKATRAVVTIKAQNDDYMVLEGLDPALPVVLEGQQLLAEGAKVRIIKPEKKPADKAAEPPGTAPGDTVEDSPGDTAEDGG